jgi:hypothetical protein
MLGHLKAEDFVNSMEGAELPEKHRRHIDECGRCRSTWESMRSIHVEMASAETDIPEPDWEQFRSSVRDELLSRSIQRESAVRRWTGWAIRPAAAWALSVVMAVGITTVTVLWKADRNAVPQPASVSDSAPGPVPEPVQVGPDKSLFEEIGSLGEEQQEQFRKLLESAQ